jgi:probable HAF family extracellular repeat protein
MRTSSAVLALAVCLNGSIASLSADRRSFEYSEILVPGATLTNAQGINAAGDIVGIYRDAAGRTHGFLWRKGEVTTIDFPGASSTDARGIGPDGEIVGAYRVAGEPAVNIHGFLLNKDATFSRVDYPNHTSTIPQRILPNGLILGCRHDSDTMETMHGIRIGADGTSDETDVPASMHNGATPDGGLIVGLFTDMMTGRGEGYVIEDGAFMPFVVPDSNFTAAWDVNPRGEIVGVYRDNANRFHGFVRDGDDYVTLDVPGATATRAFGINAGGDVVGAFVDATGRTRAFIASRTRR